MTGTEPPHSEISPLGPPMHPEEANRGAGRLAHLSPGLQLTVTLLISLVMYLIVGLLTDRLIQGFYGMSGSEMLENMDNFLLTHGDNLDLYRWLQILSTLLIFGLTSLLAGYLFTGRLLGLFDFNPKANLKSLTYIPVIILLAFPVIALVYSYLSQIQVPDSLVRLEESMEAFTAAMLSSTKWSTFLLNFLMIAILPAICEEFLFRGVLQRLFIKATDNPHAGILITGLLFGLIHGQVFKFLPIAVLGILLGYLYWWTKNLWFPILAHFFHNGIQVVLYFLVARGWVHLDIESAEMLPPLQSALFAVLFAGVMYLFYNANRNTADESI